MKIQEIIRAWKLMLGPSEGTIAVPRPWQRTEEEMQFIRQHKAEILSVLERRRHTFMESLAAKRAGRLPVLLEWEDSDPAPGWGPASEEDRKVLDEVGIGNWITNDRYLIPDEIAEYWAKKPEPLKAIIFRNTLEVAFSRHEAARINWDASLKGARLLRWWIEPCGEFDYLCVDTVEKWLLPGGKISTRWTHHRKEVFEHGQD